MAAQSESERASAPAKHCALSRAHGRAGPAAVLSSVRTGATAEVVRINIYKMQHTEPLGPTWESGRAHRVIAALAHRLTAKQRQPTFCRQRKASHRPRHARRKIPADPRGLPPPSVPSTSSPAPSAPPAPRPLPTLLARITACEFALFFIQKMARLCSAGSCGRGPALFAMPRRNQQTMLIVVMLIGIVQYARQSCCFRVPGREYSAVVLFPCSARLSSFVLPARQLTSMHAV